MKRKWENMTPEQKKARVDKLHEWRKSLSSEEFSKIQTERLYKRWSKLEDRSRGPMNEEWKEKIKRSTKSFWSGKTPEERTAIALANWEKRRAKA